MESTELEKMLAGAPYAADDPDLVSRRQHCQEILAGFNQLPEQPLGHTVLGELFDAVGEATRIQPPFICDYGFNISIGHDSFWNFGGIVLDSSPVTIGNHVEIATGVQLLTAEHPLDPAERRAGVELNRPITIEDGAWLGGGVIVLPGVTIGENSVVGAGSVVTRNIEPGVVAFGNPCRVIRPL